MNHPGAPRGHYGGRGGRGRGRGGRSGPQRSRPNHFLAIRLTTPAVIEKITELQKNVSTACSRLEPLMIRPAQLHITLQIMALDNPEAIKQAADLLHSARPILDSYYKTDCISLNFMRVQHFNGRVLWLEAEEDEAKLRLKRFIHDLQSHFHAITKEKPDPRFIPHLTVLKGRQQADVMPDALPANFLNSACGKAEFMSVHLYRMQNPKEADGGYGCITSIHIGGADPAPIPVLPTASAATAIGAGDESDEEEAAP